MEIPVYGLSGVDVDELEEQPLTGFKTLKNKLKAAGVNKANVAKLLAAKKAAKAAGTYTAPAGKTVNVTMKAANNNGGGAFKKTLAKAAKVVSAKQIAKSVKATAKKGGAFTKLLKNVKNAHLKKVMQKKHDKTLQGIEGIFDQSAAKIDAGTATQAEKADFKKAKIMLQLEGMDYDAFRLAAIYMPYVEDIDENDGGYIFPTQELAAVAAWGEQELIDYTNRPDATELGKLKIFKKIGKAIKKAAKTVTKAVKTTAKAVANTTKAAVKSAVNTVKASANLVKAGVQAATGNAKKAKETLKKAGQQAKSAVVDPVKQAVKDTKALVKDTIVDPVKTFVVDPLKQTIKIMGKVFKVLFILINPVTVLIRSSIRAACALNLFGVATKMGVGLMREADALKIGYSSDAWKKAKNAVDRFKKLFKKMGGNTSKLEKSIKNGANKKPLLKKDIRPDQKINFANGDDGETTLGDPATVGAIIAAAGSVLAVILKWVADVVTMNKQIEEQKRQEKRQDEKEKQAAEQQAAAQQAAAEQAAVQQAQQAAADEEQKNKNKKMLIIGGVAVAGLLLLMNSSKKKKK